MKRPQLQSVAPHRLEKQPRSLPLFPALRRPTDAPLAVLDGHMTYIFPLEGEVVCVHFDSHRRQIFYCGHCLHNVQLNEQQRLALQAVVQVLRDHPCGRKLVAAYQATLGRLLADNQKKDEL